MDDYLLGAILLVLTLDWVGRSDAWKRLKGNAPYWIRTKLRR